MNQSSNIALNNSKMMRLQTLNLN